MQRSNSGWVFLLLVVGVVTGISFPDYRHDWNNFILPFGKPLLMVVLATFLHSTKRLGSARAMIFGLISVYISDVAGIITYGTSCGWHYVIDDSETHAVLLLTVILQTITYCIALGALALANKLYKVLSNR